MNMTVTYLQNIDIEYHGQTLITDIDDCLILFLAASHFIVFYESKAPYEHKRHETQRIWK